MQTAGDALLAVGGAALGTAAVWWFLQPRAPRDSRRVWLTATPSGVAGGARF
jgi:hypothetical protein